MAKDGKGQKIDLSSAYVIMKKFAGDVYKMKFYLSLYDFKILKKFCCIFILINAPFIPLYRVISFNRKILIVLYFSIQIA